MRRRLRASPRIAALLLCASLALPTTAAASDGPGVVSNAFDCAVLRPFGLVTTVVGGILFLPAALLTAPSGEASVKTAWRHFVLDPVENTFGRPLGDF